jgi:thioredoxin 1
MNLIILKDENFNELIKEGYVLVDYFATWCGPCKMLSPILEEYSLLQDEVKVIKVDVDQFPLMAQENNIMGVPTLILYKDKKEIKRLSGYMNKEQLQNWVDQNK